MSRITGGCASDQVLHVGGASVLIGLKESTSDVSSHASLLMVFFVVFGALLGMVAALDEQHHLDDVEARFR